MTGTALATERRTELAASYDPLDLPPLADELMCALSLPPDLPAELSIAEVAGAIGISPHTLRYYERIGLVEVDRNAAGYRRYDRQALARVVFVTRLRMSDMPIHDIRRYVELIKQGPATEPERLALMQAHRATIMGRLQDLQAALAVIDYKIVTYGGACSP
jgi:DNA-binding transcriptional MerR regulator